MNPIITTVRNGKVDVPVEWPEGTEVRVEPACEAVGMREEDWDDSPEGIEAWIRQYRSLEPLAFTPEEEAAIAAHRLRQQEFDKASFSKHVEGLFE